VDRGGRHREVLSDHDARALIGASAASQLGDWLYNAALLGYVYAATDSAAWVGAATIARLVPYVLLGPVGGAVADRYPRRTVLLAGDLLRLLAMLVLAAVVAAEGPVVVVIAVTMLASAAGSAEKPAAMALLPGLVGELRIGAANALLHTVQGLGIVVGPALGALLLAVGPDWSTFLANAGTFAISAMLIATIRRRDVPAVSAASTAAHVRQGLRTVRKAPQAVWLMVVVAMVELTYGAQSVQLVVYAHDVLDLGTGGYGLLLTAIGAGGVLSTLFSGHLASRPRVALSVVAAAAVACASQLAFASAGAVAIALAIAVVAGAAIVTCEVIAETALVGIVPGDKLGRVMGVFDAVGVAAMIAGALVAPLVLDAFSLEASFVALGGAALAVAVASRAGLRGLDAARARRLDALASRLRVVERMAVTRDVPRAVLEQLAAAAQECPLPPGVDVVVEGAPAHAYYAVVDGTVVVHRDGEALAMLQTGDGFGERGLLDDAPRNATVTTQTDAMLLRVEGQVLLEALAAAPGLRSALDTSNRRHPSPEAVPATAVVDDPRWVPV
jgi:MFS family permease